MLLNFLKKVLDIKERTNDIDLFTIAAQELKIRTERHQRDNDLYVTEYEKNKMNTLKEFGLVNSEFVVNTESDISKIEKIQRLKEVIKYFNKNYPNNPFILYSQAKKICENNNFIFCSASLYTKNIPDGNFSSIKNFKLKNEDKFYYGIIPSDELKIGIQEVQHVFSKGFEVSNKQVYETFKGENPVRMMLYNKKVYFDSFPVLICTQPHNLFNGEYKKGSIPEGLKEKYNIKYGHTLILKPVYKDDIYGFLIITTIKDTETNEQNTRKKRTNWE